MSVPHAKILETLQWRYAVKRFDPAKKISKEDWEALAESLRMAPSSYGLQPWKFHVVQTPDLRAKLKPVSWGQSQVTDCSHFVVFTVRKTIDEAYVDRYVAHGAQTRKVAPESMASYRKMMVSDLVHGPRSKVISFWAERQSYLAMGILLHTAALLRIDSCPLEGIEPEKYDELLGISGGDYRTVAAVALGYRHPEDKYQHVAKIRFPADDIFQYR